MADYAGRIRGDYAVDSDGAATYSVPIEVPPGTAGMMPKLSVGYNSGGGDDLLGMGWSLRGLSSIGRSPKTVAQDGQFSPVSYNLDDRFSLDGQRLVPVRGSYGAPDAVYRTEIESWIKVVPVYYGQGGNTMRPVAGRSGPDAFIVYSKDGKVHEYGTSIDAQIVASPEDPSIRVWALNKITDLSGNYLTITYDLDRANNTFYPHRVQYTGNDKTGLTPQRAVVFSYEPRPSGADAVPHCLGGYPFTMSRRLSSIETLLDGKPVFTYGFNHQLGQATGRSRLVSITQADSTGAALPATVFSWPDEPAGLLAADQPLTLPCSVGWQGTLLPMDVNGDGRGDLVNAYSYNGKLGLSILLSDGEGFTQVYSKVTEIPFSPGNQLLPIDVNGNGCIDLVCAGSTDGNLGLTVLASQSDGNGGWELVPGPLNQAGPTGLAGGGQLSALDVDGDGLVDLVYAYQDGDALKLKVLFSNGTTFAPSSTDRTRVSVNYHQAQYLALDFNGDGMTDLLYAYQTGDDLTFALFLSQGREGFIQTTLETPTGIPARGALFALDANGDGIGDLVHSYVDDSGDVVVQTILSNGVSFQPLVEQRFSVPTGDGSAPIVLPMEVNGDGLPDLVVAHTPDGSKLNLTALLATGNGYTPAEVAQPSGSIAWGSQLIPVDYNGDGRTDLVYAFSSWVGVNQELALRAMPVAGPFPDLLTGITDGLGGQISINYSPLTDPDVYRASAEVALDPRALLNSSVSGSTFQLIAGSTATGTSGSVPATRLVMFPRHVVASYTKSDGRGNAYSHQHSYGGARIDLAGRGWLGFAVGTAVDHSQGTTTQTDYQQSFPHTHLPISATLSQTSDAALMQQMKLTYTEPTTAPYLVVPRQRETTFYTLDSPDFTQTTSFTYDAYGNVKFTAETSDSPASLPRYTTETYQNDHDRWRLGYKTGSKVTADEAGTQILSSHEMTYFPDNNALCTVSAWDHNKVRQTTSYEYDAYGNQTTVTDASHATTSTTYDSYYYSFPATKTTPPTANAAQGLTWTYDYHPAFGVLAKTIDPNGTVTGQQIDGLGRVTGSLGPDPSGAQVLLSSHVWANNDGENYREVRNRTDWIGTAWRWSRRYLDGLGRTYRTATLGPDGVTTAYVDYTLNSRGQPISESLPYYKGQRVGDTTYIYDVYARPVSVTKPRPDPGSAPIVTTFTYPNVLTTVQTDGFGTPQARTRTAHFGHYGGKRVIASSVEEVTGAVTFTYDALGRITSSTDAATTSTVSYDTLGRRVNATVVSIDQGTTLFSENVHYDDINRTVTQHDADGQSIVWTYDALRRLSKKQAGSDPATTISYDSPVHSNAQGRASSVTLPDGSSYQYAYDPLGNQTSITLALDGRQYQIQKSYTPTGKLQQLTCPAPSGLAIANSYNAADSLTAVGAAHGAPSSSVTYDGYTAFGVPATVTYGNGVTERAAFDGFGRLLSRELAGSDGNTVLSTTWGWDPLSQLTTIHDSINLTQNQTFGFDDAGRLTEAHGEYPSQGYAYDAAGNLTLKDGIAYSFDGCMVTHGTLDGKVVLTAEHDAVGSRTSLTRDGDTTTYAYDAERRLIHCGNTTFGYDHTGRRLKKQTTAGMTTYYVSPYYEVTTFADGSTQHTAYLFGINGPVASITTVESGSGNSAGASKGVPMPGTYYLHKDQIGSTIALTDARGAVTSRVSYLPYGEIASLTGPDCFRHKFTGKELDEETGLYYFNARYYDPALGRFLTLDDRMGGQGGNHTTLNLYAYALNDPTSNVDPSGHSLWSSVEHAADSVVHGVAALVNDVTKAVANVFSNDVRPFFQHYWQQVVCFTADGVLIAGGATLLALTPFTGSPALGAMLLGAGIGGLTYNIAQLASHQKFSWKDWGTQVGIGAATGLVGGVVSTIGDVAISSVSNVVATVGARLGLAMATRVTQIAARTVIQSAEGALIGATGQVINNGVNALANHQHVSSSGLGWSTLIGAATAGLGSVTTGGLGDLMRFRTVTIEPDDMRANAIMADVKGEREGAEFVFTQSPKDGPSYENTICGDHIATRIEKFAYALPGLVISWGGDAAITNIPTEPTW